jgi:hypothetical protein
MYFMSFIPPHLQEHRLHQCIDVHQVAAATPARLHEEPSWFCKLDVPDFALIRQPALSLVASH